MFLMQLIYGLQLRLSPAVPSNPQPGDAGQERPRELAKGMEEAVVDNLSYDLV